MFMSGVQLELSDQVKYLVVILDQKVNWPQIILGSSIEVSNRLL